jgi:ABC-2 type transport system permease protein
MNKRIIAKELRELIRSARFAWCAVFLYALLLVSLLDSISYYKRETVIRNDASKATYQQWLEQGAKNPHSAAHYGFYAYKPVSPLAIIDKGLDDYLGNAVWLEAHNQNEVTSRQITDRLSLSRFGQLTPGMLLYFFLPLLLIILGYNNVSRELENDTLRMLLSTGVSNRMIVISKTMALFIGGLALTLPAFAILTGTQFFTGSLSTISQLLILFLFLVILYGLFSCIITAASAWSRHSSLSLVVLVAFWLSGAVIMPRLAGIVARQVQPTPTAFAFYKAVEWDKENGLDGHNPGNQRAKKYEEEVLARYGVKNISELPVNFAGLSLQAGEEYGNQVFDKHFGSLFNTFNAQDKIISATAILSPFMAARNTTLGFAGADINRHALYVRQAENYRRHIQKVLNEDFAEGGAGKEFADYIQDRSLWGKIDNFSFTPHTSSDLLQIQVPNILVLLVWSLLSIILLLRSVHRLTF